MSDDELGTHEEEYEEYDEEEYEEEPEEESAMNLKKSRT